MILLQLVFQVVQIIHSVTPRRADIFTTGDVLNLAQIVSAGPHSVNTSGK